jgi:signal transduction histidine kinase
MTETNAEISTIKQIEDQDISRNKEIVFNELSLIYSDILVLSERQSIQEFLMNDSVINTQIVAEQFLTFANFSGIYDQVRLLDETGMEVIRINYNYSNPFIVPEINLQNKSKRYYFEDTFSLDKGQVFVSPLDLNIEHGEIEQPLKPMIRIGTPVFGSNNSKRGIVLVNYLAKLLLDKLSHTLYGNITMLNSDGYWLLGIDPKDEWGFMYPSKLNSTLSYQQPQTWDEINKSMSGQFYAEDGLITFNTIHPLSSVHISSTGSGRPFEPSNASIAANEYYWKILSVVPNRVINNIRNLYLSRYMFFFAIVLIISSVALIFLVFINTRRKHTEEELRETQEELITDRKNTEEEIVNLAKLPSESPYPILRVNRNRVIYINDSGKHLLNLKENDEISKFIQKDINEAFESNSITESEVELKKRFYSFIITPLLEKGYVNIYGMDITEKKQVEQKLKEINKLKSEFLRRASHELKTPLISIKGYSDLILALHKDQINPDVISKLNEINRGCERLQSIINNLLATSRLESPDIKPKVQKEDLTFLIKFCIHELQSLAQTRNQSINLNRLDGHYAIFEKEEIHDVISNLLTNAIKYTPPYGKIDIKTDIQDNYVVISIKDNGIGFTNDEKKKIFHQFGKIERYGQGLDLGIDGTGLGLYISKRIVESHGGKIWMESEGKDKGSTFYFSLPLIGDKI